MGLAFPLVFLLTAVAWLVVAAAIVLSWVPRFANSITRMWRICMFLTVSLSLLPIVLAYLHAPKRSTRLGMEARSSRH